jgi:asparagine synthase (glutamine-hydrolysing)
MCGIAGQFNFLSPRPVERSTVEAMTRAIAHRGPDDEGYHFSGNVGLGFRRLSIIDLAGGHQPMSDPTGSVWVVFNGEIYNFQELRSELEGYGHTFRTRSDTEVIVHGYRQWGTGVLNRLNGMFGLAIWDEAQQQLTIARDSAGIKLVYYRVEDGSVDFGSELRAVLAARNERPEIDMTAVNLFLRYRYTPSPLTLYKGINKLAPGTMAVFSRGAWRVERWYSFRPHAVSLAKSDDEATEELLAIYKRALKRHLISDVPVGLLLSGGLDSGLLLGLMSLYGSSWPTYTVGYGKSAYQDDELNEAAESAAMFSATNVAIQLSQERFEEFLPRIVSTVEEPIASSSVVPMYFLCERARQDVKVALMGQGPDELFGGYTRHLGVQYGSLWRNSPTWLRRGLEWGIGQLPRNEALKRGVSSLATADRLRRYQNVFSIMPGPAVDGLFRDGTLAVDTGDVARQFWSELEPQIQGTDELGGFQVIEIRSSLPDELLMYADKLSMAHGLEIRVPYLDQEVVEYAANLPARFKVRNGKRKWLHRRVCQQFLSQTIIKRKKRGFAVNVVDKWFHGSLNSKMGGYLLDPHSLIHEFLKPEATRELLDDHRSGRQDNHKMLFSLIVFEEWLRTNRLGNTGTAS